ncbi:MAG TPA: hypothetical protein VGJ29_16265 [Vicinamibacterales bacterium]
MDVADGRRLTTRRVVETVVAGFGILLIIAAVAATQRWLDHHFLPSFFLPRVWYVRIETLVRVAIAATGAVIVFGRSQVARLAARAPAATLLVVAAAALAIAASELALRSVHLRSTEWLVADEEPQRQPDEQLGWVLAPDRVGRAVVGGRTIDYAIDRHGYRVRRVGEPVDVERPVIVFAGESVMFGEGLAWTESIPAQAGARLDVPIANIAVHGYSTDQIYLRLARELPRFRQPLAVVSIVMTELFGRNLDDDRPHLGPGLVWLPAQHASRLAALAGMLVPYRREETVEEGIRNTREVLHAIVTSAEARHAAALIVVPQFGCEDEAQRALRERILAADIPQVVVPLDPDWRLAWDRHPNAHAAQVIAAAIAARLTRP